MTEQVETGAVLSGPGAPEELLSAAWTTAQQRVGDRRFTAEDPRSAAQHLVDAAVRPGRARGEHVHLANAYSIALASADPAVRQVFDDEQAWLLPDGRPITWVSALRGDHPRLRQVRGPQLMLDVADLGRAAGLRHYLLGGSEQVLADLRASLEARFPGIRIVGASSPPFRQPTVAELADRDAAIAASGAQIVWVGLGTPKQDFEAARLAAGLPVIVAAVGAAFDYAAGSLRPAPHWVSEIGMEWAWRLGAEPRRLWRRYTFGSARFIGAVGASEVRRAHLRHRELRRRHGEAVVVVGQLPPPLHGSAVMTERLIEALHFLEVPVAVVDRRFSRTVEEVGALGLRKLMAVPSLVGRFVRAVSGRGPIVMLITTRPATFLLDVLLLVLARRPAVLYVHTVGFRSLAARGRLWDLLVRRVLGRADRVVVLGPTLIPDVEPFLAVRPAQVIPNCTPSVLVTERAPGARLLFLSNLLPGKGADVFVRLAARLQLEHPDVDWRFDLAGAGDPSTLPEAPDRIVFHGRVVGEHKEHLLRSADLLIVPSTYGMEAQPLVIVEALAHGLPVVAYDNGGIRDVVDRSIGALVPMGDEEALAESVVRLVRSPEDLTDMRRIARRRHQEWHSLDAFAEAWRAVLGLPELHTLSMDVEEASAPAGSSGTAEQEAFRAVESGR